VAKAHKKRRSHFRSFEELGTFASLAFAGRVGKLCAARGRGVAFFFDKAWEKRLSASFHVRRNGTTHCQAPHFRHY